ncbi:hypothetical protein [Vibrio hangzhouensis]|uniref:hypothetical protein n=1 Tax=Vibrio hangzhouensis TaxID=462991 RepID=UPI001C945E27|nr:hypothetical protein [Vibrio hangzhouensis]MBY6196589.1 hypothetical protein [Vibrio hangzhouensis]
MSMLISISIAVLFFYLYWNKVDNWQLGDNDNYMRLNQILTFIDYPSWYVMPLKDFNPQESNVIHWSRLPDLPILGVYYIFSLFTSHEMAIKLSITIVPLFYLVATSYVIANITCSLFGKQAALFSYFFTALSLVGLKFLPGSIDHHNLQLLLFSIFLYSLWKEDLSRSRFTITMSLSIVTSIIIGLEVLPFFVTFLVSSSIIYYRFNPIKLVWLRDACFVVFIVGVIGVLITQSYDDIMNPKYDVVSMGLMSYFLSSVVILSIAAKHRGILRLLFISLVIYSLNLFFFSDAIKSPYSGYPELLVENWLSHVIEAKSLATYTIESWSGDKTHSFQMMFYYFFSIVPALITIFFIDTTKVRLLWFAFFISLVPVFFWQVRVLLFSIVLSIPLLSYLATLLLEKTKVPILRLFIPFLLSPIIAFVLITSIFDENSSSSTKQSLRGVDFINLQDIAPSKLFAPLEQGAEIIALTDHAVIAAPYHRNIRGNLFFISALLAEDMVKVEGMLCKERIDYLFFDASDPQLTIMSGHATESSLLSRLVSEEPPSWLVLVASDEIDMFLYKFTSIHESCSNFGI